MSGMCLGLDYFVRRLLAMAVVVWLTSLACST
ncbi:hypothetical protein DFA_10018 [Cavenderia fasciculata]|uniref:Uncharacterized protein n=1 Tax=Cavenderia fasciculata TaxID=261658 RepID=F4Q923_CACFS|nr:uncharacterized protein DFA_10018 [Cavenderia fasciculata]EGG15192.1 hypothetical protein DFA_10018 [Cavenderia fasciculata]|eukprot:XP_004351912.1 hypothetical protein DFA_10018 [Cavenderia fasciculata]